MSVRKVSRLCLGLRVSTIAMASGSLLRTASLKASFVNHFFKRHTFSVLLSKCSSVVRDSVLIHFATKVSRCVEEVAAADNAFKAGAVSTGEAGLGIGVPVATR